MAKRYITMGIDEDGCVYGLEMQGDMDFRRNELGYDTSCVVVRPVGDRTMDYYQNDEESVLEIWQMAVHDDRTRKGLREFFEEWAADDYGGVWSEENWPGKDESWCQELLEAEDNPTVAAFIKRRDEEIAKLDPWEDEESDKWFDEDGQDISFRKHVERLIEESGDFDISDNIDGDKIATWESAGWWSPKKPFVIELAPKELLEEYYRHLEETSNEFRR